MLRELYTLAEKYVNKKVFIWETNRNSMMVFAMLAYKRVDICGFVTPRECFRGEKIMNRPVVGIEDVSQKVDVVIILADECDKNEVLEYFAKDVRIEFIFYSECLAVDYRLRDKKVILYGMGKGCEQVQRILEENNISVYGYTLTTVTERDRALTEKKIYEIEEIPETDEFQIIIAVMPRGGYKWQTGYKWEMLTTLENRRRVNNIYLYDTVVTNWDVNDSVTFQLIDKAYKEKKKIYIYGPSNEYGKLLDEVFDIYEISNEGFVDEALLYDMYYEGFENKFFVVNAVRRQDIIEKCNQLEKMGLSLNELAYTGIGYVNKVVDYRTIPDCLVNYVPSCTDYKGINIHGNREAKNRILVLGGSTSTTGYFRIKSWVDFLYERINKEIGDVVIYNFANAGNDVVIELLKLLRDGYHVKPDYVISLSGVNNLRYKEMVTNQFNVEQPIIWLKGLDPNCKFNAGLEIKEDLFVFWRRIQKIIKAISESYGAKYLGVLQPMNVGKVNMSLFETMIFEEEREKKNAESFHVKSEQDDFYMNLMTIFEDTEENMYTDGCHYSELANRIIAERIGDAMVKMMG